MSPEQAQGRLVDPRSDVFSFGIILYEMLTGRRPFAGDNPMAILTSILRDTPLPVAQLAPSTPVALDRIVGRCLEKKPEARYPDASAVRDELARERCRTASARGPAMQSQWTLRAISIAALGLAAAAVVWSRIGVTDKPVSQPLEVVPLTSDVGDEESPSFSPDGNQVAYSWNGEGQDNYDIYVKLVDAPKPLRLTTDPAMDVRPAFSPDGRSVGFVRISKSALDVHGDLGDWRAASGVVAELPQDVGDPITPFGASWSSAWLPDGKSIVLDGLRLLSLETGEVRDLTDRQGRRVVGWFPAVAPDGRTLAFARPSGLAASGVYLLDCSGDGQFRGDVRTVSLIDGDVWGLTWTADGRALVYSQWQAVRRVRSREDPLADFGHAGRPAAAIVAGRRCDVLQRSPVPLLAWPSSEVRWTPTSGARRPRNLGQAQRCLPCSPRRPEMTGTPQVLAGRAASRVRIQQDGRERHLGGSR